LFTARDRGQGSERKIAGDRPAGTRVIRLTRTPVFFF
jgi:hypothetical protein